jgi:predicted lactoylglutathione lyase
MIVNDEAFVMRLTEPFFKTFTKREICDREVLWMDPKAIAR